MRWSDVITLIVQIWPEDGREINENGFAVKPDERSRSVFGNKKAAWNSEFYRAQQIGVKVEFNIELYKVDYQGETLAEFGGKRYRILRVDESKNGEFVTLVLSDLSERSDGDGEA